MGTDARMDSRSIAARPIAEPTRYWQPAASLPLLPTRLAPPLVPVLSINENALHVIGFAREGGAVNDGSWEEPMRLGVLNT